MTDQTTVPAPEVGTLPCLVCGTAIEPVDPRFPNQPHDAQVFAAHGHYGATCFDPFDGSSLRVHVCRTCLHAAAERGCVAVVGSSGGVPTPWRADHDHDPDGLGVPLAPDSAQP